MTSSELKGRTMDFAVRVLKMVDALPKTTAGETVGGQIARSGTSVAANYRAALRAKSDADFINKITIVREGQPIPPEPALPPAAPATPPTAQ